MIAVGVPIALPSVANLREGWQVRAARVKAQRASTRLVLQSERVGSRLFKHQEQLRSGAFVLVEARR